MPTPGKTFETSYILATNKTVTRSSAVAEKPRDASCH